MNPPHGESPDGVEVEEVDVAEAAGLADVRLALLLDVREDDEWATGHAPAAVHVPLGDLPYAEVPSDRLVLTVCRSGNRSATAAAALLARGIEARNVRGGMRAWQAAGLPITPEDEPSGAS